ncbi:hypothetical protein CDL12_17973 [Handroanthus impetiginosus]|uniref:Uncharacterized protein n=1 Tax=Handroanthus impetiginosus TaxID=429701 RepID=A0A2G9GVX9_9LAMI|nr:hypothetical protein CDL12_17973 [Handroanthus impetiginosus]
MSVNGKILHHSHSFHGCHSSLRRENLRVGHPKILAFSSPLNCSQLSGLRLSSFPFHLGSCGGGISRLSLIRNCTPDNVLPDVPSNYAAESPKVNLCPYFLDLS